MRILLLALIFFVTGHAPVFAEDKLEKCVQTALKEKRFKETRTAQNNARAPGPGVAGGTKKDSAVACVVATRDAKITGAATAKITGCNQNRCKLSDVSYSADGKKACVSCEARSESKSFGAGGWCSFTISATVERSFEAGDIIEIYRACREATKP